jgi:hypothetical protein
VVTFAPFEIAFDRPQLTEAERADHAAFEWWYFDCQTDDGIQMVILFSLRNPVFATQKPSVYIEFRDNNVRLHHVSNFSADSFSWSETPAARTMRIGSGNTLQLTGQTPEDLTYEIALRLPWITADLKARPLHRGFVPGDRGCYFRSNADPARRTCVSFSAPVMSVEGRVTAKGTTRAVQGRGYHDHPWGTAQLFFTHQEWHWGRLSDSTASYMFADVTPASAFEGTLRFMFTGTQGHFEPTVTADLTVEPAAWKKDSLFGIRFPHQLSVQSGGSSWNATVGASMLDTPVYNRAVAAWSPGQGSGWIEYFHLRSWLGRLALLGGRLVAFFWRRAPFFGQ